MSGRSGPAASEKLRKAQNRVLTVMPLFVHYALINAGPSGNEGPKTGECTTMCTYIKFRFTNGTESTAGLIMETAKLKAMTFPEVSRLFPMYEATKMHRLDVSPEYPTWEGAFNHKFKGE